MHSLSEGSILAKIRCPALAEYHQQENQNYDDVAFLTTNTGAATRSPFLSINRMQ
jgi:hypothetical protein